MAEQEQLLSKSIIGVIVAILGNIGIAVALNMQKRAHNSLKLKMEMVEERRRRRTGAESGVNEHSTDTLIQGLSLGGGGEEVVLSMTEEEEDSPLLLSDEDHATLPSTSPHLGDDQRDKYISGNGNDTQASYLSSKLWWLGLLVMILGELGNFIAYGFAPAVLVAPLGTVALVCFSVFDLCCIGSHLTLSSTYTYRLAISSLHLYFWENRYKRKICMVFLPAFLGLLSFLPYLQIPMNPH